MPPWCLHMSILLKHLVQSWKLISLSFINRPINTSANNRPQYEALGSEYSVCAVYSQDPRAEVHIGLLNFAYLATLFVCGKKYNSKRKYVVIYPAKALSPSYVHVTHKSNRCKV